MSQRSIREYARQRYDLIVNLIAQNPRNGERDQDGIEIGTYEWVAKQVVREMGNLKKTDGTPVLPRSYLIGGEMAAMSVGRDYHRIKKRFNQTTADNLEAIREREGWDLKQLLDRLYSEIMSKPSLDRSLGLIDKYLKTQERFSGLMGINMPARSASLNINIDWSRLTRAQLDRIASGEPPELVIADRSDVGLLPEEAEILDAEYVE